MILIYIYIAAILVFGLRTILFCIGSARERKKALPATTSDFMPFVSVIVPARNEEENIRTCIESIAASSYPADKFEIIAVNDRSDDNTGEILLSLAKKIQNLKIHTVTEDNLIPNLQGKPGAIQSGINLSVGEIILMTDADCTVPQKWIETHVRGYLDKNVGLIASFTNIKGTRIFDKLQASEWVYMHTMGSAGIGLNQPLGCYGNNLSVRKSDYKKLGGYQHIKFSVTEDLALLLAVINSGRKVRYVPNYDSAVETIACRTFGEYLHQKHRWAIGGLNLGLKGALFVITSLALWAGIIISLVQSDFLWTSLIVLSRIIGDYCLMLPSFIVLKKHELHRWVLPAVIFFILMEAVVPFLILKPSIKWKGQIFKKS